MLHPLRNRRQARVPGRVRRLAIPLNSVIDAAWLLAIHILPAPSMAMPKGSSTEGDAVACDALAGSIHLRHRAHHGVRNPDIVLRVHR